MSQVVKRDLFYIQEPLRAKHFLWLQSERRRRKSLRKTRMRKSGKPKTFSILALEDETTKQEKQENIASRSWEQLRGDI